MTCVSASKRFALASSRVSPSEKTSGNSSNWQVKPPSDAGSKTAVSFIFRSSRFMRKVSYRQSQNSSSKSDISFCGAFDLQITVRLAEPEKLLVIQLYSVSRMNDHRLFEQRCVCHTATMPELWGLSK